MADDDAAPHGELTETSAAEEQSGAAEPESAAHEASSGSDAALVDTPAEEADESTEVAVDEKSDETPPGPAKPQMSHIRLATIAGLVVVLAMAGLAGWLGYNGYTSHKADEQRKLFLQVGRQGAINLTTIDWEHAEADVQRVLDSSTGTFYDDFQSRAQPFVEVVKQAQSKSVGSISEAGLESESENGAQVLVAVTVNTTNAGAPEQQPRSWRMRISVEKVGDEAKVSNVEFVP
jgi:Mce-associated membrane protein